MSRPRLWYVKYYIVLEDHPCIATSPETSQYKFSGLYSVLIQKNSEDCPPEISRVCARNVILFLIAKLDEARPMIKKIKRFSFRSQPKVIRLMFTHTKLRKI